jgi:conjugal transfer/entry exclusion protein
MENNLAIFSGLKNNSRRTLSNTKKHIHHTLARFPSYEFDIEEIDDELSAHYDPSDYDTLSDVM